MSFFKKIFTESLAKTISVIFLALYFIGLTIFFIYSFIYIHNLNPTELPIVINLYLSKIAINAEIRLIFIAVIMGILGALLQNMWSLAVYVGNRKYTPSWFIFYLLRPFISIPLAVIFYLALRGGILNWDSNGTEAVNEYGIAAICGFAGMFTKEALAKLKELFETLFNPKPENTQYQNRVND